MIEKTTDPTALFFWYAMFATPIVTIPLVWRTLKRPKISRVIVGLVFACIISFFLYFIGVSMLFNSGAGGTATSNPCEISKFQDSVLKVEMELSAFGVESDEFPSISVVIDFTNNTSRCEKSFYNPAFKNSTYSLSKSEMVAIKKLLSIFALDKLKTEYSCDMSDQPNSVTKIFTTKKT